MRSKMKPENQSSFSRRLLRASLAFTVIASLSGCAAIHRAALRETEVYFRSESLATYPPKPPEFVVPVLNSRPPKSTSIGTFRFTTDRGEKFAIESAIHNARKCGADAVYIRKVESWAEPYSRFVPAQTNYAPTSQWVSGSVWVPPHAGAPGRWVRQNTMVQGVSMWYTPAHTESGWYHYSYVDAQMLRVASPPHP